MVVSGAPRGRARLVGTIAMVAGTFVSVLGSTILNVPISHIAHDIGISISDASLLITAQGITFAIMLPLADWLGNRLGRRNSYCAAIATMGWTSVVCALTSSLPLLVAMRILQGLAAAAIVPLVIGMLSDLYEPDERPLALSAWAMANSAGQALGPPLGGILTSFFGWRSVFVPAPIIALFACIAVFRYIPAYAPRAGSLEWRGALTLTAGALLLLTAFTAIPQLGAHSPIVATLALGGIACAIGFVLAIRSVPNPFISPAAFRERSYRTSCIGIFAATIVFGSSLLAIPLYLIQYEHIDVALAGFITLTLPLAMAIVAPLSGGIVRRYGSGRTMQLGLIAIAIAAASIAAAIAFGLGVAALLPAMLLIGAAVAAQFTAGAVGSTATEMGRYGAGVGFFNLVRVSGAAAGAALVAIVLQANPVAYASIFAIVGVCALAVLGATVLSERGKTSAVPQNG